MATAADLLKKAESRSKTRPVFQPQKRRAWDYAVQEMPIIEEVVQKDNRDENRNNQVQISEQNRDENRNNQVQISEQNRDESENEYKNDLPLTVVKNKNVPARETVENLSSPYNEKSEAHILKVLRKTSGYQQKIMEQITAHIKSLKEITNTINIPISTLAKRISSDKDVARTSIKRLQQKLILLKAKGERGRHGSTYVLVPDFVIKECINLFDCTPLSLDEIGYINRNEYRNDNPLYSSNNINITTKTAEDLPENWSSINIEPLKEIGFSVTQLRQLYLKALNTPEVVQESINHFAFGLGNNPNLKKYSEPLNVLMGVLRKGQLWTESNYVSPQEIAQQQLLALKKAETDRLKKLEEETYKIAFEAWKIDISDKEVEKIISDKTKGERDITPKEVKLSSYYRKHIWPEKKKEYLIK